MRTNNTPKLIFSARGSALIESLGVLSLAIVALSAGMCLVSHSVAKIWLEHSLYQRLQCELKSGLNCQAQLAKKVRILSWGKMKGENTYDQFDRKFYKTVTGSLEWQNTLIVIRQVNPVIRVEQRIKEKTLRDSRSLGY